MECRWKEKPLAEVVDLVIDHRGKTPKKLNGDWAETGYRVLSAKNIKTGHIVQTDAIRYVDRDLYQKWMPDEVRRGDVFVTSEAPFGQIYYWDSDERIVLGQRLFGLRLNRTACDPKYAYYWMCGALFQSELRGRATGTTVVGLRQPELLKCTIRLPSMATQKAIANMLGAIDDKIALNYRINDHLLEMALSEYKELSRQSSSKRTLQDCTSLLCRGGAPKYCEKGKFRALNQRCIRNHKIDDANARRIENPKSSEKLLRYGDILICSTGTGTLGRSAQVLCHDERVTVDSHVTIVRPAYEALVEYLGCWALSSEDQFESMAKGSTGQTELPRTELAELEIGFPDTASLDDFSGKTKPLFEAIQSNVRENQSLECLRDALLSKLMSGEIDVSRIGLRQLNGHLGAPTSLLAYSVALILYR